jgi:hypothetical protein
LQQQPLTGLTGKIKQSAALFRIQSCPVVLQTSEEKRILFIQPSNGETSALQPTGLSDEACECGDPFAAPAEVKPNLGDRSLQMAAFR